MMIIILQMPPPPCNAPARLPLTSRRNVLEVAPTARTSPGKQHGNAQSALRHRPRRQRRRSPLDLQRRLAEHPLLRRHRRRTRGVRETRRRQGYPRGDPGRTEREEHDRRRRHQGDGASRPEIRGSLHHPAARPLRGRAQVSSTCHRAAPRLVPRRRPRSRRRLRFPDCRPRRQIRHARSARRHPLA